MHRAVEVTHKVNDHLDIVHSHTVGEVVIVLCELLGEEFECCHDVSVRILGHCLVGVALVYVCIVPGLCLVVAVLPVR